MGLLRNVGYGLGGLWLLGTIFGDDDPGTSTTAAVKPAAVASTSQQTTTRPVPRPAIAVRERPAEPIEAVEVAAPEASAASPAAPMQFASLEVATVTASSLRARSAPSTRSRTVASVGRGTQVVVTGERGEWRKVRLPDGRTAWMHGGYLSAPRTLDVPAGDVVGRASVTDGDTLVIRGERIRLQGIDAPEDGQRCKGRNGKPYRCGTVAARILDKKIGNGNVSCERVNTDRYGRMVGICRLASTGEDLQAFMVAQGFALAYRKYSTAYVDEERSAKRSKRGMWQGRFVEPWDWRRGERLSKPRRERRQRSRPAQVAQAAGSGSCRIKGNISRSGRIYHVPGSTYYSRTKISPRKGERWFCSVQEARAAGWRAPRR